VKLREQVNKTKQLGAVACAGQILSYSAATATPAARTIPQAVAARLSGVG
jgi:hypothetical protein